MCKEADIIGVSVKIKTPLTFGIALIISVRSCSLSSLSSVSAIAP